MQRTASRAALCTLLCILPPLFSGCRGMSHQAERPGGDPNCQACQTSGPGARRAWLENVEAEKADRPVGARQKFKYGKMWPPWHRPTGPQQTCMHRYHNAHYWPHPYICQDRSYVRTVSHLQTVNGWMEETTLWGYHFEEEIPEVTDSGRLKLRWILENAPPEFQTVHVQNGPTHAISQARMEIVRRTLIEMVGEPGLPPIVARTGTSLGRPALEVDAIRRAELQSMPEPRIVSPISAGGEDGGQ